MKVIDPINAVITFNVAVRDVEDSPVEGLLPIQVNVPAVRFDERLAILLREGLASQLGDSSGPWRMPGEVRPEDLEGPEKEGEK